jgi:NAD(P)-dependent dehydrogenase (short-subunit alcohol dehydrogenase family)
MGCQARDVAPGLQGFPWSRTSIAHMEIRGRQRQTAVQSGNALPRWGFAVVTDPEIVAGQMIDVILLRRRGAPLEVADVICYLAGDRSSYLTGINIELAGGAL